MPKTRIFRLVAVLAIGLFFPRSSQKSRTNPQPANNNTTPLVPELLESAGSVAAAKPQELTQKSATPPIKPDKQIKPES